MAYAPLSSALILINTSSISRAGEATMSGNVHVVLERMRKVADEHVDLIHLLLGPTDMIAHLHAEDFTELLDVVNSKILPLKQGTHHYIASTETMIVANSRTQEGKRLSELDKNLVNAWVFANTNLADPTFTFRLLEESKSVFYVAHVIGRYDVVILISAQTLNDLKSAIDETLRLKNYFVNTDTRIVLM